MSREIKPQIYYMVRRGWYDQLIKYCDSIISKKGKDPLTIYWKAFGLGMSGNIPDCLRQLENFQARRDMQYPVSLALLYFHSRATMVDHEAIDTISAELSVAEDVTKEAGMALAARFALFSGDLKLASKLASKLLDATRGAPPSTPFELEASCVDQWASSIGAQAMFETTGSSSELRRQVQTIEGLIRGRMDQAEIDLLMLLARCKQCLKLTQDSLNIYNQVIAMYPWFLPALTDKAVLLASIGEWDQALDTAQRALDSDSENIDALQVVAVHAFTQESQPHDALQKLEDLDHSLAAREPSSSQLPAFVALLFAHISSRQPRALQICIRMMGRAERNMAGRGGEGEAKLLTARGQVHLMQGPAMYPQAMRAFRDAAKRDPNSIKALQGMILCQLYEGAFDDAEGQIELLTVMHSPEDLGSEFFFLQAVLAKSGSKDMKKHLTHLHDCKEYFFQQSARGPVAAIDKYENFSELIAASPDFMMTLAVEYLAHMESPIPMSFFKTGGRRAQSNIISSAAAEGDEDEEQAAGPTLGMDDEGGMGDMDISPPVDIGMTILRKVLQTYPGMVCAYVEMARCFSTLGMAEEACRCLHQCLSMQPNSTAALVAMAKVEAGRQNTSAADRALEQALSCDFSIRSVPLFRLVRVAVNAQQGKLDEAITEMEQIILLPEIRASTLGSGGDGSGGPGGDDGYDYGAYGKDDSDGYRSSPSKGKGSRGGDADGGKAFVDADVSFADSFRLTGDDRVGAFVTLASLLGRARRIKEANKVLSEAKVTFAGSPQEVLVLVAASQLAVEKKDFDTAIRMLDKIPDDSPTFTRAQMIKAEILLNHSRDQEGFTQCFHQLVERDPSSKNYALLGEAYLRILNPESAVEALDSAYKLDPSNARLRARIGRALVATHEYHRAVDFYEAAIREACRSPGQGSSSGPSGAGGSQSSEAVSLSHDLAKLYMKLGRGESGVRVLTRVLHDKHFDATDMRQDVATLLLLTDVQRKNAPMEVLPTLRRAHQLQRELLAQVRVGVSVATNSETAEQEKAVISDICARIGAAAAEDHDPRGAEQVFQEAIQHNPQNVKAMLGLARLFRLRGDQEQCQAQCQKVILADPSNEEAAIMLSESLFAGPDPDAAGVTAPLQQLLHKHPNNYRALEKLISLLRRAGKLEEVPALFESAEKNDRRSGSHAGFRFCQGLYARYTNDIGKAITEFNLARKDDSWGPEALTHMIELYLNPDQDGAWEERESGPLDEGTSEHVAAADTLLKELKAKAKDPLRFRVLENYCLLATRQKSQIDKAMQSFIDMLEADQDYLPAVLGMATGFMVEKNQHKARNLLKRVAKMELSARDGEDFTKANLLLAKFYVDKSKYDLAQDLCKKCLAQDRSCSQAWEILGLAMEKEMDYEHAAECYEKAWKLEFEASAPVGFKLAFSYLKCKKWVQAMDICEAVLTLYPDYPRIKDEILKKAYNSIRCAA